MSQPNHHCAESPTESPATWLKRGLADVQVEDEPKLGLHHHVRNRARAGEMERREGGAGKWHRATVEVVQQHETDAVDLHGEREASHRRCALLDLGHALRSAVRGRRRSARLGGGCLLRQGLRWGLRLRGRARGGAVVRRGRHGVRVGGVVLGGGGAQRGENVRRKLGVGVGDADVELLGRLQRELRLGLGLGFGLGLGSGLGLGLGLGLGPPAARAPSSWRRPSPLRGRCARRRLLAPGWALHSLHSTRET